MFIINVSGEYLIESSKFHYRQINMFVLCIKYICVYMNIYIYVYINTGTSKKKLNWSWNVLIIKNLSVLFPYQKSKYVLLKRKVL